MPWHRVAGRAYDGIRRAVYARRFDRAAARALAAVTAQGLRAAIPPDIQRSTRRFLAECCGGYRDDTWHRVCAAVNGRPSPYYLSESLFFLYVVPALCPPERAAAYLDKNLYDRLGFRGLPETCVRVMRGRLLDADYAPLPTAALPAVLGAGEVFIKPSLRSGRGRGAQRLGGQHAIAAIVRLVDAGDDAIVQRPIVPCAELARLQPRSLTTIRVMSWRDEGTLRILSKVLHIGAGGEVASNGEHMLMAGIDGDRVQAVALDHDYRRHTAHPDTGQRLADMTIPGMAAIEALCIDAHSRLPDIDLVSWDASIDDRYRPRLIEANIRWQGCCNAQIAHGPLFGGDTPRLLSGIRVRTLLGLPL